MKASISKTKQGFELKIADQLVAAAPSVEAVQAAARLLMGQDWKFIDVDKPLDLVSDRRSIEWVGNWMRYHAGHVMDRITDPRYKKLVRLYKQLCELHNNPPDPLSHFFSDEAEVLALLVYTIDLVTPELRDLPTPRHVLYPGAYIP